MENTTKHIILGAGGAIGKGLTGILLKNNANVKLVSRSGLPVPGAVSIKADLTKTLEVQESVEADSIVYLLAGLQYNTKVWNEQWPKIMHNTIEACSLKKATLIFFDNVYLYGKVDGPMTENSPINPNSKKGEIRARIANDLLTEANKGNLKSLIARSADFYGPYADKTSIPDMLVIDKLLKGHKPQWLVNAKAKHSFSYTVDCAEALFILAKFIQTNDYASLQDGKVWHLPTAKPPLTGEEFISLAAKELSTDSKYSILNKLMLRLAGLFEGTIREAYEMLYQSEYDYIFDSSKFEKYFTFKPTPYEKGIRETIKYFRK